ncbi:DUF4097 family beta strand repeat-containing protein [Glycomyces sp. A-F 0318]|uniref:DUF4097 family beta strand repeat-containing protein n=1 Tax=Glycomyces amatae TaxID=2881355 RepID=UPI001E3C0EE9|nr:DUF4097 family beta strand repeat-containing protein [Glycomyces amatae]MCD0442228.1 DUF4097 family beta strand repeat-containing protein [Glycomyces amatae]
MIDTPEKQSDTALPDEPAYPNRKVWWIVGGTLTGALLLFVMAVAGVWIWAASSPEEWTTTDERFAGPVTNADIGVDLGDIELEQASGTDVELRSHAVWRGSQPEVAEEVIGSRFTAMAACDDGWGLFSGINECRVDYTIALPAGTAAEAATEVGDIRMDGLDGDVAVETSVGDVHGVDLRTADLEVEASVGNVELEFEQVLGDITVTAGTGDVVIEVPDDGTVYAVRFDAGVGEQDIDIATDAEAKADRVISVNAGVGDLTVRYAA